MKCTTFIGYAGLALAALACNSPSPSSPSTSSAPPERDINMAESKYFNDTAIQNAIIAQHTLYPYHFVTHSACLNELGEHDFNVLVDHYKTHPGPLNLRRGDAAPELHEARLQFISDRLAKAGINIGPIEDGHPGGEGMLSEFVLMVIQKSYGGGDDQGGGDMNGTGGGAVANRGGSVK
ncbi:MAG TPA: hypothetical protein VJZ71_17820 [Phycisphaerae bacterium]|nr:hypothetical protein [Phycisphaerae bacterium]